MGQRRVLEASVVGTRENPGFIRSPGSIRAGGDKVPANLDDALSARSLLREDVTKDAALLLPVIVKSGAQLIKDAAGNKSCCCELRIRMRKLLA